MDLTPQIRIIAVFLCAAAAVSQSQAQLRHEIDEQGIRVTEASVPILFYQRTTTAQDGKFERSNYVHPLCDLNGKSITEDFPSDHLHHRGVFWAWHQVWVGEQQIGDPWVCRDFVWDVNCVEARTSSEGSKIIANVDWKSPKLQNNNGEMITIASERVSIVVHAQNDNHRLIDFDIVLTAKLPNVKIGGSDDAKGYGGFSPRIRLSDKTVFEGASGEVDPTRTAMEAGRWINVRGDDYGLTMIQHKENPTPNTQWILRRARSMQNPVYPGRTPVELSRKQGTRLRYRLVIHRGDLSKDQIEAIADDYK